MRRTLFLVPSHELSIFVRGTTRRAEYGLQLAQERVGSSQLLDKLLNDVLDVLNQPRTRNQVATALKEEYGYRLKLKAGGGWGDSRTVPHVEVGGVSFSIGFLLHVIGAREAICSGPSAGNESTYVRADRWLPNWKEVSREEAEEELLNKYLRAFGPASVVDFAMWMGLYVRDARKLWLRATERVAQVDIGGRRAEVLESDLSDLKSATLNPPVVHLLPNFDTYLLGHKSHLDLVDEGHRKKVYRPQGWVSPVVLVNGRAVGVWSFHARNTGLEVRVASFSKLGSGVTSKLREKGSELGEFVGIPNTRTVIT